MEQSAQVQLLCKTTRFLCDLWGADKVYRAIAYGSKIGAFASAKALSPDHPLTRSIAGCGASVGMARYTIRFWGTLDALQALLVDYYPHDKTLSRISKAQALSMLVYHPVEHYTWVGYTVSDVLDPSKVDGAMRFSCQLWVVWILLEFIALRHKWKKLKSADLNEADAAQMRSDIKWRTAQMMGDLVLGMHWSVKGGVGLSQPVIGALGLFGALVGGWQKWKSMA